MVLEMSASSAMSRRLIERPGAAQHVEHAQRVDQRFDDVVLTVCHFLSRNGEGLSRLCQAAIARPNRVGEDCRERRLYGSVYKIRVRRLPALAASTRIAARPPVMVIAMRWSEPVCSRSLSLPVSCRTRADRCEPRRFGSLPCPDFDLSALPAGFDKPRYDRANLRPRLLHLGFWRLRPRALDGLPPGLSQRASGQGTGVSPSPISGSTPTVSASSKPMTSITRCSNTPTPSTTCASSARILAHGPSRAQRPRRLLRTLHEPGFWPSSR